MFTKQIKVNGKYVKGMIQNSVLQTSLLVVSKTSNSYTIYEIEQIIEELETVKNEMKV